METLFGIADGQISSVFDSSLSAIRMYFHFWTITLVNVNGLSPNLVCALILWRSALELLMAKYRLFWTELSARNTSVFYFQNNNLSKSQWIFTKFDICVYIVRSALGLLIGKFRQFLTELSARDMIIAGYYLSRFIHKEDSLPDFLFVFLHTEPRLKMSLFYKKKKTAHIGSKFFPLSVDHVSKQNKLLWNWIHYPL